MKFEQILKVAVRGKASDIILKTGSVPRFRHNGILVSLADGAKIESETMSGWVAAILPKHLEKEFDKTGDVDFGYETNPPARFRVNVFKQRGQFGMVLRIISPTIRTLAELKMPSIISQVANMKRGLVLVTGATGSGKSTTLAALIEQINQNRPAHIITIEDPIEFIYDDKMSTINQREIGQDTIDFASALRASLRQDPDIILVGELRDEATTSTALMAADTGHLVFSTLHTQDSVDSLTRLLSYFSPHKHQSVRIQLAESLKMVISQRLVPKANGDGRTVAIEILVVNSLVKDVILNGTDFSPLTEAIKKGRKAYGMQSFDQSLKKLFDQGIISREQAIAEASSRENMKLLMSGINTDSD